MSRLRLTRNPQYPIPLIILLAFVLMSACTSTEDVTLETTAQPTSPGDAISRPPVGLEPTATIPAPSYREPITPITLDTVAQIGYLGRLDTPGRKSTIFNWTISPDGTQLVGINNDLLMEWNLVTGRLNFNTARLDVTEVLYSFDKNEVYGIEPDGNVYVYRSITGNQLTTLELHDNYSGVIAYDDTNSRLAVAGTDGTIKVWDLMERVSLVTFDAHEEGIVQLAFSSDGTQLASTAADSTIKLWNWQSKEQIAEYDLENAVALDMIFSPDNSQLAVATRNFVAVWDLLAQELDYVLQTGTDTANEILTYSPDGQFLATGGEEGDVRLWNSQTSNLEIQLPNIGGTRVDAAFSPDSALLATTVLGQDASLWNLTDITDQTIGRAPLDVETNNLFGVAWSSDGYALLFFDGSGEIYVWGVPAE